MGKIIIKALLIWCAIIPLAILNGGLRDEIIFPLLGELALPISCILLCILIFIISIIFIPRLGKHSKKKYLTVGILWIVLTVIFEFLIGFAMGNSFAELINAYDITTGNLWSLVVLFTGISPLLAAKTRKLI